MSTVIREILVEPLTPADRADWERLARGYHAFYRETATAESYEATWTQLMHGGNVHGLGAFFNDRLVGIAHYVFHEHVWREPVCYLQDLFVDETVRGHGAGRAMIEHVAGIARERGAFRLYWMTAEDNVVARALYDTLAHLTPFIRYDFPLS